MLPIHFKIPAVNMVTYGEWKPIHIMTATLTLPLYKEQLVHTFTLGLTGEVLIPTTLSCSLQLGEIHLQKVGTFFYLSGLY